MSSKGITADWLHGDDAVGGFTLLGQQQAAGSAGSRVTQIAGSTGSKQHRQQAVQAAG